MILRDPLLISSERGGVKGRWGDPGTMHHVYRYTSDPDPNFPEWARTLRPKWHKAFFTRVGGLDLIVPESGTNEELNHACDQRPDGLLVVDGKIFNLPNIEALENNNMAQTPYILVETPKWRLLPETSEEKGVLVREKGDLKKLTETQLLSLFHTQMPEVRRKYYRFKNKAQGIEYVWNIWELLISRLGPRAAPEVVESVERVARPRTATARNSNPLAGSTLHPTDLGISARRKAGTRRTDSWNVIREGMSFDEYVEAGGHPDDLAIIVRLGHVTFK